MSTPDIDKGIEFALLLNAENWLPSDKTVWIGTSKDGSNVDIKGGIMLTLTQSPSKKPSSDQKQD